MKLKEEILLVVFGVAIGCLVMPIFPLNDDWGYLTAPNPNFDWMDLCPGESFWRPFDALWGGMLAFVPFMFPWLNKCAIVIGHILCTRLTFEVLREVTLENERLKSMCEVALFACSCGVAATLVNTDSINQVWCCVWGLLGAVVLLRNGVPFCAWFCFVMAILFKESGVSWLVVGPILVYARDDRVDALFRGLGIGCAVFICYMCVRFALQGHVSIGDNGYYAVTFLPSIVLRNLCILVGLSMSNIDVLALFTDKKFVFISSVALSILSWTLFGVAWKTPARPGMIKRVLIGIVLIFSMALPHCFSRNHHPAEMHFYPVILGGCLAVGIVLSNGCKIRMARLAFGAMMVVYAIGWCDKIWEVYCNSARAQHLFSIIQEGISDSETNRTFVVSKDATAYHYSVFTQSAAWGLDYGTAFRTLNGWDESKIRIVEEE